MKNGGLSIIFVFSCLLLCACVNVFKLSDLRTDGYHYPNNIEKAKTLLAEMGQAHQIEMWDKIETYEVTYKDEFYGFIGKQAHPFKEQDMTFQLSYIPGTFDGQMQIASGKENGKTWGYQSGQTYRKLADGSVEPKKNKDMKFWIPTYQYFIEFPSRIQEASSVDYVGENTINGINVEGVLASWNTINPQKDLDQYLIWLDAQTKQIVKIEYTVRDAYKFVTGAAYYQDYKNYDGIILPSNMPVESNLVKKGILHKMGITNFEANRKSIAELRPLN